MNVLLATAVLLLTFGVALLLIFWPARRPGIRTGRFARINRLGKIWARLATTWLGSLVRKMFAGPAGRDRIDAARRQANAELVAREMGQMKGALMKIGQMLSFVSEEVPAEYRAALASLQTSAPAMEFALIRDVVESELGRPLERAFARFESEPLAAASIGQVHRAELATGEQVVVKVQYPGVADAISSDLGNADMLYSMLSMIYSSLDPKPIVEELRARIGEELDYKNEAQNQRAFAELYAGHPFIRVPRVIDEYCSERLLTSEYVSGRRFAEILLEPNSVRSRYGEMLYRFVFGSIFRFGVFNGDPHPGNYLFDEDGRMVFLDFGCVKYFPVPMLERWKRFVQAHLEGDARKFYELSVEFGFIAADANVDADRLFRYFGYFYEPFHEDRSFRFTRRYTERSFRMVFRPEGEFEGFHTKMNMPRDFVFANRLQWGVYSVLADLEAEQNFHRIHREFVYDEAPSSELGQKDAEFWARFRARRGLDDGELLLTHAGVIPRDRRAA